jgi:hypothetical protein
MRYVVASLREGQGMKSRQRAADVGLELELIWKDEDMFELRVSAWNGSFGGVANICVGIGRLKEIASRLSGFPTNPSDEREIVLGTFGREFAGGAARMRFYCADRAGHAYLESKIESEFESVGVVQNVVISMPIEAAAVDVFVEELGQMEAQASGTARLKGIG